MCVHVHVTRDCSSRFHVCLWWATSPTFYSSCNLLCDSPHILLVPLLSLNFSSLVSQKGLANQPFGFFLCLAPSKTTLESELFKLHRLQQTPTDYLFQMFILFPFHYHFMR